MNDEREHDWGRMGWGMGLMALGVLLLADRFGQLPEWVRDFRWWGLIVGVFGLAMLIKPRRADTVGNGVSLVLLSVWFLAVSNRFYGLTWFNSWPLALVAVGADTFARALAANWLPDPGKDRRHARRQKQADSQPQHAESEVRDA